MTLSSFHLCVCAEGGAGVSDGGMTVTPSCSVCGLTSVATGHIHRWDTKHSISYQVQEEAFLFDRVICPS